MRIILLSLLAACGQIDEPSTTNAPLKPLAPTAKGLTFDANADAKLVKDAPRMVRLLGEELGADFEAAIAGMNVRVQTHLNAVECNNQFVAGCTRQHTATSYDIDLIYRWGDKIDESAFAHEMAHVYACALEGECDSNHERRDIWQAVGRAQRRFIQ